MFLACIVIGLSQNLDLAKTNDCVTADTIHLTEELNIRSLDEEGGDIEVMPQNAFDVRRSYRKK